MNVTDTKLRTWDAQRLRVSRSKRATLLAQVANLVDQLRTHVPASSSFKVVRFRRAGSLRKATAVHPRGDTGIDADIAVYLDTSNASDYDLATMHSTLREIVRGVYPTKKDSDFWVQPHTLGMQFHASGLSVDLVPLIAIEDELEEAYMVSSTGGRAGKTNVPGHLKFVGDLAKADGRYRPLVRMAKTWRNEAELGHELSSFAIELILAELQRRDGPAPSLELGLQRFFLYLAQTGLLEPILSGHEVTPDDSGVVILDPCNSTNNVAVRMVETERQEVVAAATIAWETLVTAHHVGTKGETSELWREVFGTHFSLDLEVAAA
ncbi:CBASS oligonucleotide cyclase [Solirubrobacter taibaiensis]|nr:CBASS oligonucleotide cyclase [Solirubrobacter taibaiensis]